MAEAIVDIEVIGDNVVIPGIAGKTIRVLQLLLSTTTSDTNGGPFRVKDGDTPLTGFMGIVAGGPYVLPAIPTEFPWFTLSPGNPLVIERLTANSLGGRVYYTQA